MNRSDTIGDIAGALALVANHLPAMTLDGKASIPTRAGSSYSYSYTTLTTIMEKVRPILAAHGIAILQPISMSDGGGMVVETTLLHASGEYITSHYPLRSYDRAQDQGSAITYARRYAISAMLGLVADEDEDGAAATATVDHAAAQAAERRTTMGGLAKARDVDPAVVKKLLAGRYGKGTVIDLDAGQWFDLVGLFGDDRQTELDEAIAAALNGDDE